MKNNSDINNTSLSVRFERGDLFSDKCPSREILSHVTSRWGVLILAALHDGKVYRFSELRRKIKGVSEKMLAQSLKNLELDGFVVRTEFAVVPPHVEYTLSALGSEIAKQVVVLVDFIENNTVDIVAQRALK